nr:MAG TPA: hypothetical protein [Caudoviricetes sp.]
MSCSSHPLLPLLRPTATNRCNQFVTARDKLRQMVTLSGFNGFSSI